MKSDDSRQVSKPIDLMAAYSWRLLIVAAAIVVIAIVLFNLRVVMMPVFIALLATTVLRPPADFLERKGFKPALATATVFLGVAAFLVGLVYVLASPIAKEFGDLGPQVNKAVDDVNHWLVTGPLHLEQAELDKYVDSIVGQLQSNAGKLGTGLMSSATLAAEIFTGILLSIILSFFFVKDGDRLVRAIIERFPAEHQPTMRAAGSRIFYTLGGYLRGVAATGLVDATLIGIVLFVLNEPLLFPLVLLTFLGAFFPVVGAATAGFLAAAVALVNGGVTDMIIVIVAVLVVQQVEGHLLQPLLVGRAVALHPVVILLSLGSGAIIAGLLGAFLAVPFAAVIGSIVRTLDEQKAAEAAALGHAEPLPPQT